MNHIEQTRHLSEQPWLNPDVRAQLERYLESVKTPLEVAIEQAKIPTDFL